MTKPMGELEYKKINPMIYLKHIYKHFERRFSFLLCCFIFNTLICFNCTFILLILFKLEKDLIACLSDASNKDFTSEKLENKFHISNEQAAILLPLVQQPSTAVNCETVHTWTVENNDKHFHGKVLKMKKNFIFKIAYWSDSESVDDSLDYDIHVKVFLADLF